MLEPRYQELVKSSKWCDDVLDKETASTIKECSRQTPERKVGILSLQDYNLSYNGISSYLNKTNLTWYSNFASDNEAWSITSTGAYPNSGLVATEKSSLLNVVPALALKASTSVLAGDGSITNPYLVLDTNIAKKSSELNKREIGEYINYSGYTFRISNILDDGTVEVIMESVLKSDGEQVNIGYTNTQKQKVYNPNQEGNIGYKIKNDMTRYINTDLFVRKTISVPIYDEKITYQGEKNVKKYKLLVTIPSTFDIFSARPNNVSDSGYWLIDSSKAENIKAIVRSLGTVTYVIASDDSTAGVKLKAYFDKDTLIRNGSGTFGDPYTLID